MSHEIQLMNTTQLAAHPDDLWHANALAPAGAGTVSPVKKIQRLLRGRVLLAIVLGIVGATAGAFLGWNSQTERYASDGVIWIRPITPSILRHDKVLPFYDKFVQSQINVINSQRVLDYAVKSPEWHETGLPSTREMVSHLRSSLDIGYIRNTQQIRVTYIHPDPNVAQTVVKAVINAYAALYSDINGEDIKFKLDQLELKRDSLDKDIRGHDMQIQAIVKHHGSDDLSLQYNTMTRRLLELEQQMDRIEMQLSSAQAAGDPLDPEKGLTIDQIAMMDATMRAYVNTADQLRFEIERLQQVHGFGANAPVLNQRKRELELQERRIKEYAENIRKQFTGQRIFIPERMEFVPLTAQQMQDMRSALAVLQQEYNRLSADSRELYAHNSSLLVLKKEIERSEHDLERFNRQYEELLAEAAIGGNLAIIEDGSTPVLAPDKRKQVAFVGMVTGGSLPLGLLLLLGLVNTRYRYSEDANDDVPGLTLLGILPNLPDRLTDPTQAATAAHCVHQIRTMLQINFDEAKKIYAITSASPGDGKTSLTLALGLSFAASGSRTLVIDCDLVGAGLTARLDVASNEGVLEAMSNRALMPFVRPTDVADLSILPVGNAQAHHAGMFSPQALRRVLEEARNHFDVILIDSGPILGSIEATPACAAADGVILTVSRGQQRPLVEKAMNHLMSIGARFAGIVFNRAQAKDFERSVSGISLRSIHRQHEVIHGRGNGHGGGFRRPADAGAQALGPVARAVASSVKPTDPSSSA